MEKFAINLENVKNKVLFDCILMGSEVARKYEYDVFYTNHQKQPDDWYDQFIEDLRSVVKHTYKGEFFYVSHPIIDEISGIPDYESICYIFFRNRVYSFDNYYTYCPVFQSILKSYE
jgi:hypothetical protein